VALLYIHYWIWHEMILSVCNLVTFCCLNFGVFETVAVVLSEIQVIGWKDNYLCPAFN